MLPSLVLWLRHVQHVLDAVDLLLDRRGDGVGDRLGVGAGVVGGDDDGGRRDLRDTARSAASKIDSAPTITVTIEITAAKTGRSMKKCANFNARTPFPSTVTMRRRCRFGGRG